MEPKRKRFQTRKNIFEGDKKLRTKSVVEFQFQRTD